MRFGKRLAEITHGGRTNEPYVSYKELKHIVSRISTLVGSSGRGGGGDSSGDDGG
eukprot:CAMPEP_0183478560 /NCGR_PEP_ID=MMETSP0370-20130417/170154_1 /TAXON_ID=268820 /ORGANISM="Peridinium aciculiferum, Strain PAER-2" /LENGTH=54 /DNA_ID=CAMNT_0025671527 /DNA_START=22 /DNA_END=183 /DNA_ORIENTATION=+